MAKQPNQDEKKSDENKPDQKKPVIQEENGIVSATDVCTPAEVEAYWTPERQQQAKPMPMPRVPQPKPKSDDSGT